MDYIIKNHKGIYIRLNKNGAPETCSEHEKTLFEYSKANNVLKSLKKSMKRLNFKVEPVLDIMSQTNRDVVNILKKNVIENTNYELSETVSRWIDRFGNCYDVLQDAENTSKELLKELERTDKEILDILHSIELETPKDLYNGWLIYKAIRENRKKRRVIKDEMLIINNVLEKINPSCLNREKIQKAIDGLFERKYKFRIIEEEENESVM